MIYDEMDDRPSPEDERAEAWEYWHERANKFEAEDGEGAIEFVVRHIIELLKLRRLVRDLECIQSVEVRRMIAEYHKDAP